MSIWYAYAVGDGQHKNPGSKVRFIGVSCWRTTLKSVTKAGQMINSSASFLLRIYYVIQNYNVFIKNFNNKYKVKTSKFIVEMGNNKEVTTYNTMWKNLR